jgi:hypothetical protein
MIDTDILEALDNYALVGGDVVWGEAAALIRRLQKLVHSQDYEIDVLEGQLKFALEQVRQLTEELAAAKENK